jgi:2-iminobutanoate/2-iminopropanoate deaminase
LEGLPEFVVKLHIFTWSTFTSDTDMTEKTIINSQRAPEPIGPYNQAIKAGNTLYVSGQIAINRENGDMVQDDIAAETHQVMTNLEHILHEAGMAMKDIVKCTIFIRNMDDFQTINGVYGQYFPHNHPARETVEVSRLPKGANVEISCVAVH